MPLHLVLDGVFSDEQVAGAHITFSHQEHEP
jgi:hypothetical protein